MRQKFIIRDDDNNEYIVVKEDDDEEIVTDNDEEIVTDDDEEIVTDDALTEDDIAALRRIIPHVDELLSLLSTTDDDEEIVTDDDEEIVTDDDEEIVTDDDEDVYDCETPELLTHDSRRSFGSIERRRNKGYNDSVNNRETEIANAWKNRYSKVNKKGE